MTTQTVTHNPVLTDTTPMAAEAPYRRTGWALAGIAAGVAGVGSIVASGMVDAAYDAKLAGDPAAIAHKLSEQTPQLLAFHVLGVVSAVLLLVFAAGLHRRLRATSTPASLAPVLTLFGLAGTAIVMILGTGLDTEFMFSAGKATDVSPDNVTMFNHWVGTIPWLWVLVGVAGLALFAASRERAVPRWMGLVALVGGGLTLLLGISPLQYMAGMTGPIGVVVIAAGFAFGDRVFRRG